MIERFGIAHDPIKKGDEWRIIGRCVTDIHVGDRFAKFVPIRLIGEPGPGNVNFVRDDPVPINLTLVRITSYQRNLIKWSAGLTAALVLIGDGDRMTRYGSLCSDCLSSWGDISHRITHIL